MYLRIVNASDLSHSIDSKSPKAKKWKKKEDDHDYTDKKKVSTLTIFCLTNELLQK